MKSLAVCLLVVLTLGVRADGNEVKSYIGYHLLRAHPTTSYQVDKLKKMAEENLDLDFWTEPFVGRPTDINTPPGLVKYVRVALKELGLSPLTIQDDVQMLINHNTGTAPHHRLMMILQGGVQLALPEIVGTFPRHDDVLTWLEGMANTYSSLAKIEDIGNSYEGRKQRLIKIGASDSKGSAKQIIWIDSAIHAREWLTVGTTIWIINKLLTNYGANTEITDLLNRYDWYFLPISNPDGYEYTHTNDRLWRKTRTPTSSWRGCKGVDPNRNWDAEWMVSGTSTDECSSTYGGPNAFSEPCTENMKNAIWKYKGDMVMYMGVHSYSQMWLTPWAYGGSKPADYQELLRVADAGNDALRRVHDTRFVVGTPPDILYSASGGAYDWVKMKAGVKYSYTYELRPDGNTWNGFVVSENEIEPSGEEIWASLAAAVKRIEIEEQ